MNRSLLSSLIRTAVLPSFALATPSQALVLFGLLAFPTASEATLPSWDFESSLQGWSGTNATVAAIPGARDGGTGTQMIQVTMSANGTYDGARVDITNAIPEFQSYFSAGQYVEISAWVRIPDSSDRDTLINLAFKAKQNTTDKFTYLDQLRTGTGAGIRREDGWVKMRSVIPSFRMAWDEYTNDRQTGATYSPTSLTLTARAATVGDTFLIDEIRFTPMITGVYSSYAPPGSSSPDDFLRPGPGINGFRLLDANGADVILNGINMWLYSDDNTDPASLLWNYYLYSFSESDLFRIREEYGMNVLRLNLDYRWFEKSFNATTKESVFKQEGFAWMDRMMELAREQRLYLILDLHTPPGGFQGPSGSTAPYFTNADLRKRAENLWVAFAQRYRHEPVIAAYDLINEPRPRSNADWYVEAERLTAAIRQQGGDSNHLVLVESPFPTDGNGFSILRIHDPANRVLYDSHYYSPAELTFNTNVNATYVSTNTDLDDGVFGELSFVQPDNWDDTIVALMLPPAYEMSETSATGLYSGQLTSHARSADLPALVGANAAPVNVGEFGLKRAVFQRDEAAALAYLADIHQVMDHYSVHRQYWSFRADFGLHDTFAGFLPVPRLRNETFHQFLVNLKTARSAMMKPEDRDADGMADIWERDKFGSTAASSGFQDVDEDGTVELAEYLAGTLPGDPHSSFQVSIQSVAEGTVTLSWEAIPWRTYVVERATTLAPADFTPIASRSASSRSSIQFIDTSPPAGAQVFYRVRVSE